MSPQTKTNPEQLPKYSHYDDDFIPGILKIKCLVTNCALFAKTDYADPRSTEILPGLKKGKHTTQNPELEEDYNI